jgi:hypothetical protein
MNEVMMDDNIEYENCEPDQEARELTEVGANKLKRNDW